MTTSAAAMFCLRSNSASHCGVAHSSSSMNARKGDREIATARLRVRAIPRTGSTRYVNGSFSRNRRATGCLPTSPDRYRRRQPRRGRSSLLLVNESEEPLKAKISFVCCNTNGGVEYHMPPNSTASACSAKNRSSFRYQTTFRTRPASFADERIFRAPPLTRKLRAAIKRISP